MRTLSGEEKSHLRIAAIFDAVNSVDHRYRPYAIDLTAPTGASAEAAAAAAAHRVLVSLIPTQLANLDAAYVTSLAAIPDGASKTDEEFPILDM